MNEGTGLVRTALGPGDPDDGDQGRRLRGLAIAALAQIREVRHGFKVPSQSRSGAYLVNLEYEPYCSCPDFKERQQPCKHVYAVQVVLERRALEDGTTIETQTIQVSNGYDWPAYREAQEYEGEHFGKLLRSLCDTIPPPERVPGAAGRPPLPLEDVLYGVGLKVYSTKSSRRAMSDLRSAERSGLLTKRPSPASVIRYLEKPTLTPLLRSLITQSALPLRDLEVDFAVDSTGFASTSHNRWFDHKHGETRREVKWVKLHLMCGVQTNIVTAADCTPFVSADVRFFEDFVKTTAKHFTIQEVSADKAYLSRKNLHAVDDVGGTAFIPFRESSRPRPSRQDSREPDALWERMYHYFSLRQAEFLEHYHKRSNVEATFHMIQVEVRR